MGFLSMLRTIAFLSLVFAGIGALSAMDPLIPQQKWPEPVRISSIPVNVSRVQQTQYMVPPVDGVPMIDHTFRDDRSAEDHFLREPSPHPAHQILVPPHTHSHAGGGESNHMRPHDCARRRVSRSRLAAG